MTDKHGWNHPQCYPCWFKRWGLSREPSRFRHGLDVRECCFCGRLTGSGIFIRERPGSSLIPCCSDGGVDRRLFWPQSGSEPAT